MGINFGFSQEELKIRAAKAAAANNALRQKIRNELILNKPPEGIMAGLYKKIPTNMRLLAENLVGVDRPITNKDFTNDELVEMAFMAEKQKRVNEKKEEIFRSMSDEQKESMIIPTYDERLGTFENTKGKTSVNPYKSVGNEPIVSGRKVDKGYLDSVMSSFTDPRYGVATTLGKYNVYDNPEGDSSYIKDTYNFNKAERKLSSNPYEALRSILMSPEIAGEYLANSLGTKDRPVNIELNRKQEYPLNLNYGGSVFNRGLGSYYGY